MQYTDIKDEADFLANSDDNDFPEADKDRAANKWLDFVVAEILDSMDDWDFQGQIATHDLSATQQEYPFPTDLLTIKRVEVDFDGNGKFTPAGHMDINEFPHRTLATSAEINDVFNQANPRWAVLDESVFLYPVPDSDQTDSVKIWYTQDITQLTSTAAGNTSEPSFVRMFHPIISYGMVLDYAARNDITHLATMAQRMIFGSVATRKGLTGGLLSRLKDFYSSRTNDKIIALRSRYYKENYK